MKKPMILAASLSLIGAGSLVYWQKNKKPELSDEQSPVPQAAIESGRPEPSISQKANLISQITDSSIRYEVRVDILRRLDPSTLSAEEIETLYTLLNHRPEAGQEEHWWVVVNEVMEQMRKQAISPDRYTPALLAIIRDADAPEVLRDYAIQHLGQWVTPRGAEQGLPSEPNPQRVQETLETFRDCIKEATLAHTSIPGTALMLMVDMKMGGVPEASITPIIASLQPWFTRVIAEQNKVSKITRISAINAIGMLGLQEHRDRIRKLAQSEQTDPSIRLNSIAALGSIGSESDLTSLEAIANSETPYRHAAVAALKKLQKSKN